MKNLSIAGIVFILFIIGLYYWSDSDKIDGIKEPTVTIKGEVFRVVIADEPSVWISGLSGWESLDADQGMLFIYPSKRKPSFWMKNMNFAIDLLWIDDNKIVGYEVNMRPVTCSCKLKKYIPKVKIDKVLELPAGTINNLDIKKGDIINFHPVK